MFETVAFYIFSALIIGMFWIAVNTKNILYALSSLAAGMIFIGGLFFVLEADFLGVVQIIVYSGAIMALYAFGMMFFDASKEVKEKVRFPKTAITIASLIGLLLICIVGAPFVAGTLQTAHPVIEGMGNAESIGLVLFTKYLVPFELASIMLLVAMVAGIILASKKMDISLTTMEEEKISNEFMEGIK